MAHESIDWRNFGVLVPSGVKPLAPPTLHGLAIVGGLGALVLAALACCLLSLGIADARRKVVGLDADTVRARRDVVVLEKELAVRARFAELDRWNAVLSLQPPRPAQYLTTVSALAAYAPHEELALR